MPHAAYLAPQVHAVRIGDDLVVLDVRADRYLCWPAATNVSLDAAGRRLLTSSAEAFDELVAAGLAGPVAAEPVHLPRSVATPQSDLMRLEPAKVWVRGERGRLLRASWDSAIRYRRSCFAELVAFGADRPPGHSADAAPGPEMREVVARFHTWAPWTPAPAKCLIRSYSLLRLLRREGHDARWVFAVRTWPFAAHCWLQAGDVVLDDAVERLRAYRPILVV